jgi:hypothetical protein
VHEGVTNHLTKNPHEPRPGLLVHLPRRTLPLFEAAWQAKHSLLPQPDVLIAAVGTHCYHHDLKTGAAQAQEQLTKRLPKLLVPGTEQGAWAGHDFATAALQHSLHKA